MSESSSISINAIEGDQRQTPDGLNCTIQHPVDLSQVRQLHRNLISVEKSQRMAEFFALLGDANRLRILSGFGNARTVCL